MFFNLSSVLFRKRTRLYNRQEAALFIHSWLLYHGANSTNLFQFNFVDEKIQKIQNILFLILEPPRWDRVLVVIPHSSIIIAAISCTNNLLSSFLPPTMKMRNAKSTWLTNTKIVATLNIITCVLSRLYWHIFYLL